MMETAKRNYVLYYRIIVVVFILQSLGFTNAAAPVASGLPDTVYVGEDETGGRLLYIYSIADPNSDSFVCTNVIAKGAGTGTVLGTEYDLIKNKKTGNYELWQTTAGATSYVQATIPSYTNTITCTDSTGQVSAPLVLNTVLIAGEEDTINNVEGTGNDLTLSAAGTANAVTVKTVSATSKLGHTLEYSLTSDPSFSPEFFVIDQSTGAIRTNRELKYLDAATPTVYLSITAYDTIDQTKVYATQTVHLTNQNTIPSSYTLPKVESQSENLASGTVLFAISTNDPDSQIYTYRHVCSTAAGTSTFSIDNNSGNFIIAAGKTLDYETKSRYNCSIYIKDGIHESEPFIYDLTVNDVNEAPTFSNTEMHLLTLAEGSKGSVSVDPGLACTDQDSTDTTNTLSYAFQNVNNSNRFTINANHEIGFNTEYDVDNNAMPSSVVLTVYCIDDGGLNSTTQVTITITDVNDNAPTFPATPYAISVTCANTPGTVIGTIVPTDADSDANAEMLCSGVSTSTHSSTFSVAADCNVYLTKAISFAYGTHVGFIASAVDKGSPSKTGTTAIDIFYEEATCTTTTTTAATTTEYNFFAHGENIAMFVLTLLAGLALLGLLTYCLLKMCCGSGCGNMCDCMSMGRRRRARYPRRQVSPETPPRQKRRPMTPEIYREPPQKIVEQRPVQVIRTIARPAPAYGSWNPGQFPGRGIPMGQGGFPVRSAPGFY